MTIAPNMQIGYFTWPIGYISRWSETRSRCYWPCVVPFGSESISQTVQREMRALRMKAPDCSGVWARPPPDVRKICASFTKGPGGNTKARNVEFPNLRATLIRQYLQFKLGVGLVFVPVLAQWRRTRPIRSPGRPMVIYFK